MTRNNHKMALKMTVLALVLGLGILAFFVVSPVSSTIITETGEVIESTSSSGSGFVVFIPIFFGALLPIFIAAQKKREEEALQAQSTAKKLKHEELDMYSAIDRLVDDLGETEFDYLKKRVYEEFGYLEDDNDERSL